MPNHTIQNRKTVIVCQLIVQLIIAIIRFGRAKRYGLKLFLSCVLFFLDQKPCISRPYRIYMRPQSTTFEIGKVFLIFTHLCEWKKKVWVNFKRKVLYFRSSNHTASEIRPATKSDIEVKTVSVTLVVEWHSTVEYLFYSIENKCFGGDCSILLEFSQFLDMIWCIFFHKNQSFCLRLFAKML